MSIKRYLLYPVVLSIVLGGVASCKRVESLSDQEHLSRGKEYMDKGELKAAVIELKNAISKNPANGEARWVLGDIYSQLGLGVEAEKELLKAEELGISMESLKVPLGRAYLHQSKFERVLESIDRGPASSTKNVAKILEIRGNAKLGQGKFTEGCELFAESSKTDPQYVAAHWGLARCALARRQEAEVRKELAIALELEPKNAETWIMTGDLERTKKDWKAAATNYNKAIELQPASVTARLGRAMARLEENDMTAANEDIEWVLKTWPQLPLAHHLKGVLQFRQGKYAEAKTDFDQALKYNPEFMPAVLWTGIASYALNDLEQALGQISTFTKTAPGAVGARSLLAKIHAQLGNKDKADEILRSLENVDIKDAPNLSQIGQAYVWAGQLDKGIETYRQVVEQQPSSAPARVRLASAMLRQGQVSDAVEELDKALELDPKLREAEELRIRALLRDKRYPEALAAVAELEKRDPKSPVPHFYRALVALAQQQVDQAKPALRKALDIDPGYVPAAHQLAGLAMREKNYDEARQIYQTVLKRHPNSAATIVSLAQLESLAGKPDEARRQLESALSKDPRAPLPAAFLARVHLRAGAPLKAIQVTQLAIKANPDDAALLEVRGLAYLDNKDLGNARTSFERLTKLRPKSAAAQFYLAMALTAAKDAGGTRVALERAVELDPAYFQAKTSLARLDILEKKYDKALALAQQMQRDHAESPEAWLVEAEAHVGNRDGKAALQVLTQARQKFPEVGAVVYKLAEVGVATSNTEVSVKELSSWVATHPDDMRAVSLLGDIQMVSGKEQEAITAFEQVVRKMPENISALNNLAWLLRKRDTQRAAELISVAASKAPKNPAVLDTQGAILLEDDQADRALEVLRRAHELSPKSPGIHYRYALALAKTEQKEQARRELEKLLASAKGFPDEADAKALLSGL